MISRREALVGTGLVLSAISASRAIALTPGVIDIKLKDSPLPAALDVYYSFVIDLSRQNGFGAADKMLLGNTITSFDISKDTPYFNEGLFRRFADRIFLDSPAQLGPANQADRFSVQYETIVRTAADKIDQRHPEIVPKLKELDRALESNTKKLTNFIVSVETEWGKIARARNLKSGDPKYDLEYLNYLEKIRYADRVDSVSGRIDALIGRKEQVRRSIYSPSEIVVLECVAQLSSTRKVARPLRPQLERTTQVNELTFADPKVRLESICDLSPASYPVGDLVKFLNVPGQRGVAINKSSSATEQHDRSWSAGASGRVSFFGISLGGSGGGSGSSSYTKTVSDAEGISINFDNVAEVLIDRGYWFNPAIFEDKGLRSILKDIPGLSRMKYVSVSVIVGRGLALSLTANSSVDTTAWSKEAISARGGASFLGFSFGGSGSTSTYDYSVNVSADGKTVTFKDDPQLTRVIAVRLTDMVRPIVPSPGDNTLFGLSGLDFDAVERPLGVSISDYLDFTSGKKSYLDIMRSRFPSK